MNKRTKETVNEVSRRISEKTDDNIIGNELRMHRLNQNITLSSLSKDTCSTSYLSKIETNRIVPNKLFLSEICSKLSLDNDNIDALINSKDNVKECIIAFLEGNIEFIKNIVDGNEGLINCRARIVEFIYYIIDNNLTSATKIYNMLSRNIKSMGDFDLAVFCLFAGVYHFNTERFEEAKAELKSLSDLTYDSDILLLRDLYIFYTDLKQSRVDSIIDYNIIYRKLGDLGYYKLMEKISYYLGIYFCKFKLETGFLNVMNKIQNPVYINSLKFLFQYYKKSFGNVDYNKDEVSDFVKALMNVNKNKEYVSNILENRVGKVELDFDYYYIEYLLIDDKKKSDEIIDYFAPIVEVTSDEFLINFFYDELIRYCEMEGRYKRIADFHKIINKIR